MPESDSKESGNAKRADAVLAATENAVYLGIAGLLLLSAIVLLVVAARDLLDVVDQFGSDPIVEVLDTLLLLFILVELLSAVRITISKSGLVAEPFLLVGIIASIKEIVVLSVKAAEDIGTGSTFRDQLWEVGVLGIVVLLLGTTAWLLRIKEREPQE
ncbi:MAG: phosphate-starvation-inducible PsiE family protein [Ilumatobacteraceae bacterium]